MSSSVPGVPLAPFQGNDRTQQIEQCKAAALTAIGLLGPAHALVGGTGTTGLVVSLFLTGVQACAVFSIISAIFVVKELKQDADLDPFVVRIPTACCSVAGTLLVIATCIAHWKVACGVAALAVVFLLLVHHRIVIAFGKRAVNWNAVMVTRVRDTVLTFGGWLATGWVASVSRIQAPPAGGSGLGAGVGDGDGEQAV